MHKNLWAIVNGNEKLLTDACKVLELQSTDDKIKAIIRLALSDFDLRNGKSIKANLREFEPTFWSNSD